MYTKVSQSLYTLGKLSRTLHRSLNRHFISALLLRCFKAGDPRVNEHVGSAAVMTILAREHNRLADELAKLNPHWLDEILFQEARRLLIAEIQIITHKEFLPLILGQVLNAACKSMYEG